ncbi:MAG: FAD-binding oxidoreductase [Altibacter sp.]|nr:FAD-binding oxidoreductase [Altibacter sp.]
MDVRSNEPLWVIQNSLKFSYPSISKDESAAITVLGGGITGALIAHKLVEEGYDVLLVEKRDICHGSTAASTAMLQYEIDVPLFQLMEKVGLTSAVTSFQQCESAIFTLENLVSKISSDCDFEKKYSVWFTTNKKDISFLEKEYEARLTHGFQVEWLTKEATRELGIGKGYAAIRSRSGAVMNPYIFAQDLLAASVKKGLRIFDKSEIVEHRKKDSAIELRTRSGFKITTSNVVNCTGFESVETIPSQLVDLKSTYAIASEAFSELPAPFKDMIFWDTAAPYHYYRGTADGRIIMGGGDVPYKNAKTRDSLLSKKEKQLIKMFQKTFPSIPFIKDYSWAGTFGETKDGLPYMGKPDADKNEHYILGYGGNGITFSIMGRDMIIPSIEEMPHPYLEYYKFDR